MKSYFTILVSVAALLATLSTAQAQKATGKPVSSEDVKEDIGDIHPASDDGPRPTFRAAAQGATQFVTNAKLQGDHSSADVLWLPALDIGYNIPVNSKITIDLSARSESVLYSDNWEESFFGFSGAGTIDYTFNRKLPRVYASVEPYWYQSLDTGDQVASGAAFAVGIDQGLPLGNGMSMVFWGARYANYQASPDNDDRHQYRFIIGLNHQFQPSLFGQVFYTYQYSDYYNYEGRDDSRHAIGASLTYQFSAHVFGSFTTSWIDNISSTNAAEYQNATAGFSILYQF